MFKGFKNYDTLHSVKHLQQVLTEMRWSATDNKVRSSTL